MIVKTLMSVTGQTSTTDGATFNLEMPKGNRGLVQVKGANYSGISAVTVKIQGRLSSSMAFVDIANGSISQNANGSTAVEDIQLYPEMRATISTLTGTSADVTVQLGC